MSSSIQGDQKTKPRGSGETGQAWQIPSPEDCGKAVKKLLFLEIAVMMVMNVTGQAPDC